MGKLIDIDIMRGESHVSASVQAGDSTVQIRAVNLPEEWLKDSTYVYALLSQDNHPALKIMSTETLDGQIIKTCDVGQEFLDKNKGFKIVIFSTDVAISENGTVSGTYRYVSEPVWVSVGEGLEQLTVEVLPDKNKYDAITTLLAALQIAVEEEKTRVESEKERVNSESDRKTNEEARIEHENDRVTAESERKESENNRIENESNRILEENIRVKSENGRSEAEIMRADAESKRDLAEVGRSNMIESKHFDTSEECEAFIDGITERKIYKISYGGTAKNPFIVKWIISTFLDSSYGNNSRSQVKIEMGKIYARTWIEWEFGDDGNTTTNVHKWSEWSPIVDSLMLENRLKKFNDEITIDVDQVYNSKSENAQSGKAVAEAIAQLVNGSPEALDTLYELANALGNDENFAATVTNEIAGKASLEEFNEFKEICPTKEMLENGDLIVGVAEHALKDVLGVVIHEHYATKEEIPPIINLGDKQDESFLDSLFEKGIYIYTLVSASQATAKTVPKMCIVEDLFATKAGEIRAVYQTLISDLKTRTFSNSQWNKWKILTSISDYVDAKIGDVETSIENIILKYGLGGDGA